MSTLQRTQRIEAMTNKLVLVRHGESEWNRKNIFTGIRNPDLTDKGVIEAVWAGRVLKGEGLHFDIAFTSKLKRAQHTLDIILGEIGGDAAQVFEDAALNERDYGELSGLNKDQARERWGEEQVLEWRRSYDTPPPGGESLKDTAARVQPYYLENIWPHVAAGKNVIIAAHGNSLRALIMHLERLSEQQILDRELATAAPQVYRMSPTGEVAEYKELVRSEGRDSGIG
jgi:2,3-bisphosphoglycerate-dependent phosphoglycerate mutase